MTVEGLRVGVSAVFDPAVTPHARTFFRAMAAARNALPALAGVTWHFADDHADPDRARTVARGFVDEGVDLVIGHFSSDAALAAIDVYAKADVALLTPAATADTLTMSPAAFRICPADAQLVRHLLALCHVRAWTRLQVRSDASAHGQAIAHGLRTAAPLARLCLVTDAAEADVVVFAGRLASSAAALREHQRINPYVPLILTDDAVSPWLPAQEDMHAPVLTVGFRPADSHEEAVMACARHRLQFGRAPETYFLESYAAFEILAALATACAGAGPEQRATRLLAVGRFYTVLGPIRFDGGQAAGPGLAPSHATFALGSDGLSLLAEPGGDMPPAAVAATVSDPRPEPV
jgi:ABC-type branched-subunit amino acid transport system substrate-binding protein